MTRSDIGVTVYTQHTSIKKGLVNQLWYCVRFVNDFKVILPSVRSKMILNYLWIILVVLNICQKYVKSIDIRLINLLSIFDSKYIEFIHHFFEIKKGIYFIEWMKLIMSMTHSNNICAVSHWNPFRKITRFSVPYIKSYQML